jgi:hypothetical protein
MNKMMKMSTIALCGALLSTAAAAQTAFQQLQAQAGADALVRSAQIETPHAAIQPGGELVTVPLNAKDVFAQCQAVDAKAMSLVAWTLPQAIGVMQSCLNKSYAQSTGYAVTAKAAKFMVPMCKPAPGQFGCMGMKEVDGIELSISGKILTGDSVLMDLNFSIKKRGGKLLGFPASIDDQAVILR